MLVKVKPANVINFRHSEEFDLVLLSFNPIHWILNTRSILIIHESKVSKHIDDEVHLLEIYFIDQEDKLVSVV
jgi:hypothetical protein